jgi:ribonuclease P protein component
VHAALKAVQDSQFSISRSFGAGQRIPSTEGYTSCLKSSSISNQYFKLFFIPNQENLSRLGIIASKKCMHRAIDRNTNKRAIREVFRNHDIKSKRLDLVVLIRSTSTESMAKQKIELANLFDRLIERCA